MNTRSTCAILCLMVIATGCCCPPEQVAIDLEAEVAAIRQADIDLDEAVFGRDVERFKSLVASDGAFYGSSGIVTGPDGVAEAWAVFFDTEADVRLRWAPQIAEVSADGGLGFTRGEWQMTRPADDGGTSQSTGWYVTIWRKNNDGRWQVAVDIGNPKEASG